MVTENLYQKLNIPDYSDISLVKQAFRHLALKYHPDRNKESGAAEKFKSFLSAYEILGEPKLKQEYDQALKSGFRPSAASNYTVPNARQERESKMRRYAKMKQEQDAIQEVENLKIYAHSLENFPFIWRILLSGLLFLTGLLLIVDGWFRKSSSIALGIFIFIACVVYLWNEIYKHFWYKQLSQENAPHKDEDLYDLISRKYVIRIILWGIISVGVLTYTKKKWHLNQFGEVIEAKLDTPGRSIRYKYKGDTYIDQTNIIPDKYKYQLEVYIRVSNKEPEIWEYIE